MNGWSKRFEEQANLGNRCHISIFALPPDLSPDNFVRNAPELSSYWLPRMLE